jgi:anti-sigma factor RsiW
MHGRKMNCDTARLLMENNDPALAAHLESCPLCVVAANAPYYEAPPGLERKIRQSLRRETAAPSFWGAWRVAAIAASVLLLVSLAGNVELLRSRVTAQQLTVDAVLSAHLRSLAGEHLLDVPSSDQHTVKPWFNGKVDFSPPVKMLPGFPLIGGRLEYLAGRPAAALIYGRNKHVINLFIWPAAPSSEASQTRNGYHMQNWSADGMAFWAISDLNESELGEFISLFRRTQP